ncbi:NUDIX hydrolase [Solibacillus sp. FSL H8-0538]|uniref:NUDIX hydrolase n=1 Tax=Solibacillus sp. FSL H8-0538 TaxID=2921400 RepID=UPI0030FBDB88
MKKDRGKVWLGVASVVENENGEWLVVKKAYSGLKGRWSLPAGFVNEGETVNSAAIREVKEETGIDCVVQGIIGFRTGVIRNEISDNMAIFYCKPVPGSCNIIVQEHEILEAKWIHPTLLAQDEIASVMLVEMAKHNVQRHMLDKIDGINPGDIFGYTEYNLFFKK